MVWHDRIISFPDMGAAESDTPLEVGLTESPICGVGGIKIYLIWKAIVTALS